MSDPSAPHAAPDAPEGAPAPLDLAGIRRRLAGLSGKAWWRSLEEIASSPGFAEAIQDEFPAGAAQWHDELSRRRFLTLMGASLALAGVTACTRQPRETISPYAQPPEQIVPGRPLHYATALTMSGYAAGALVESHEGRPTKVEGNPGHPASLGASDVFMQAAILGLYDPDRSRTVTCLGDIRPWGDFLQVLTQVLQVQEGRQGSGLRILTETITSPTLAWLIGSVLERFPKGRWHQWEPAGGDASRAGARIAFGEAVHVVPRLEHADVILSLDADFLAAGPGSLRHVREFARRRRPSQGGSGMNRLYVVESMPSGTGASADHRLPVAAGDVEPLVRAVASQLGLGVAPASGAAAARLARHASFIEALSRDLRRAGPRALILAGEGQPPAVHALAHAIHDLLGCPGTTVVYTDPVQAEPQDQLASLKDLCSDMEAGRVDILLILGGNPAHTAPADLEFATHMQQVGLRAHLSLYQDETSALCHWHIPMAHELESWGDARAYDGTTTIQQPLIEPLYGGRTPLEVVGAMAQPSGRSAHDLVRQRWMKATGLDGTAFDRWWNRALHDGLVAASHAAPRDVSLRSDAVIGLPPSAPGRDAGEIELVFKTDPSVHDGRFANIGWLQELPRPITRLTWDNAALMSPATAERLRLSNEEVVELRLAAAGAAAVKAPVWIVPGHAEDSVTVHLGYGRSRAGRVGESVGFDAYRLRTSSGLWCARGLELNPTGRRQAMACTQQHHSLQGRRHVRAATLPEFLAQPDFATRASGLPHEPEREMTLYPEHESTGHAWAMAIDLNACVGCNACVLGCQSENNIPVVGREQVAIGREMHWIRIDRYFEGDPADPSIWHQPLPCMHCENAPCEPVCPVGATVHSSEGLNDMVYNRCVGTRYCSNNCPYKVRRFNFLLYSDWKTPSLKLLNNPDVTVRSRGVMEKCTYCVQRINAARIEAREQGRRMKDGDVTPACAQACPAEAIVFGDLNDPGSRVAGARRDPRHYSLLGDLNTRPRTTYLAALRNPNPEIPAGPLPGAAEGA